MKLLNFLFAPGMRKVTVLGSSVALAEIAGVIALFAGFMTADQFAAYILGVLSYGGSIFAVGNVLEHAAGVLKSKQDKPAP